MKKGFSLIELLIVISVVLVFSGIFLARYNDFAVQLKLKNEGKKLADVLELSKKKALSADLANKACVTFSGYRVSIAFNNYSMYFNCGGVLTLIQTYTLNLNDTVLNGLGTGDYDFTPLMKNPIFPANVISIKNSSINKCVDINISDLGIIELNETLYGC